MTLWIILTLLSLVALSFVVWPLYRSSGRLTPILAAVIVLTVGISATMYHFVGSPNVSSGAGGTQELDDVVESLAKRLESNPDDIGGWMTLGRSYQTMQRYDEAIAAFEKANELQQGQDAQTLVALGIAVLEQRNGEMSDRAVRLFENALALEPTNANALFYGGGAAAQSGNTALAADRWELLLEQNAPPEIRELLQRKINEWRGLPPPEVAEVQPAGDAVVSINLRLSTEAASELPSDAPIFVIARDPAQPSPPIAVKRVRLGELPVTVTLGDDESMVAGRALSGFSEFEVLARVSLSGSPMAQSGDWQGVLIAAGEHGQSVDLVIDQKIP